MNQTVDHRADPLAPGLYIVSTPIGTARDITLRALDTLAAADVLVAEDTRSLRRLMAIHGIEIGPRPVWSYHDHSPPRDRARVVDRVRAGQSVVYAAEAGTPMVADPGYKLAAEVRAAGGHVTAAPGPSAAIVALTLAGLPTDRFVFMGFPPPKTGARRRALEAVAGIDATLIFYEAPSRVQGLLGEMAQVFGVDREAVVCRELTKRFEDVRRAPLGALAETYADAGPKGECVVLVAPPDLTAQASDADLRAALAEIGATHGLRDAATEIAARFGVPRKRVYDLGLVMRREEKGS